MLGSAEDRRHLLDKICDTVEAYHSFRDDQKYEKYTTLLTFVGYIRPSYPRIQRAMVENIFFAEIASLLNQRALKRKNGSGKEKWLGKIKEMWSQVMWVQGEPKITTPEPKAPEVVPVKVSLQTITGESKPLPKFTALPPALERRLEEERAIKPVFSVMPPAYVAAMERRKQKEAAEGKGTELPLNVVPSGISRAKGDTPKRALEA